MSNPYRKTTLTKQEIEKQFAQTLRQAKEILAQAVEAPEGKELVKHAMTSHLQTRGVPDLEQSLESVSLIIQTGNKSRELELLIHEKNLERVKAGEDPVPFRVPVSAACHLSAVRFHSKLLGEHKQATDHAVIDTAEAVYEFFDDLKRKVEAQNRTDAVTPSAAPQPVPAKEEKKAPNATPNQAAAA
jgi:hypothetical protein